MIDDLIRKLLSGDSRLIPAASETLRIIGSSQVIRSLREAYDQNPQSRIWILATLGVMPPDIVRHGFKITKH